MEAHLLYLINDLPHGIKVIWYRLMKEENTEKRGRNLEK